MKTTGLILILLLLPVVLHAQDRVFLSLNPGVSLSNSENSMKVVGDKQIHWMPGVGLAYETPLPWNFDLNIEYNYIYARVNAVTMNHVVTPENVPIADLPEDLVLTYHNFDINAVFGRTRSLRSSVGPTVAYVGRSIQMHLLNPSAQEPLSSTFEDRLQSLCLGANISVNFDFPLEDAGSGFFIFTHFKFRYLHSVWFDDRGRKLDNYFQEFLTAQVNLGAGYSF